MVVLVLAIGNRWSREAAFVSVIHASQQKSKRVVAK